ncbi:MAG: hypothetical protein ACH255_21235, partial [Candidatus Thiodiazotropha sp.]
FTDVLNKSGHNQAPLPNRSASFMEDIDVSAEGVTNLLKCLNPSKALGLDELQPSVLKELASELGLILLTSFNNLLTLVKSPSNVYLQTYAPIEERG